MTFFDKIFVDYCNFQAIQNNDCSFNLYKIFLIIVNRLKRYSSFWCSQKENDTMNINDNKTNFPITNVMLTYFSFVFLISIDKKFFKQNIKVSEK